MNRKTGALVLASAIFMSPSAFAVDLDLNANAPTQTIKGEVFKVEESYWIKDASGNKVRVLVDDTTKMDRIPKVGDKIEAQVTSQGRARSIKPFAGDLGGPQGTR